MQNHTTQRNQKHVKAHLLRTDETVSDNLKMTGIAFESWLTWRGRNHGVRRWLIIGRAEGGRY